MWQAHNLMHCRRRCREATQHTGGLPNPTCFAVCTQLHLGKARPCWECCRRRTHLETCRHARHVANLLQAQALGTQHASRQGQVAPHLHAGCSWGNGAYNCQGLAVPVAIACPNKGSPCCCHWTGGLLRVAANIPGRRICSTRQQQAHQGVVLEVMLLVVTPSPARLARSITAAGVSKTRRQAPPKSLLPTWVRPAQAGVVVCCHAQHLADEVRVCCSLRQAVVVTGWQVDLRARIHVCVMPAAAGHFRARLGTQQAGVASANAAAQH